jgi:iron complex outermembrane receptor protein
MVSQHARPVRAGEVFMKRFVFFTALSLLLVSSPISLYAQEEVTLEQVVVTGTRDVQEIRNIPANVTVITREEIERSNSQTVIDLMRSEVGVVVRDWFGNGKKAGVDIRGFGETGLLNTLVLVDGRRVNEIDLSGVDWTQIPIDQVERVEIVRGAGSVLYGDNAVGGVINIITKKPEKPLSAKVEGVIGSYHFNQESGSVSGKWGPLSAILNAGYHSTEGYRDNGLLRAKDVGGKVVYDLNDNMSFNLSGAFHRDKQGLPGGLTQDQIDQLSRRATLNPDNQASTDDGYGIFGIRAKLWDWGRAEMDFSYRHREFENFLDFPASFYTYQDDRRLRTWGVTPKYILEKPIGNFSNKLTLGFDFYQSDSVVDSEMIFFGFPSVNRSEVEKRSTGIYLLDEFSILSNLILSLGYRHEWVKYKVFQETPKAKDETTGREPAYNLSIDYLFGKKSSAFFSFKHSFRFPVSDELILVFPTFKVNPIIKPQTGYHYEAGVRHFFLEWIETNLTLFWIDLHNEIFFNPATFTNENYPKTRRQGIELGVKVKPLKWLSFWGNYAYIRPRLREDSFSGNDIPGVARHKGTLGGDFDFGKGFLLNTRLNIMGSRYFISDWANQVDRLDEYYTVDAKFSYSWKGLKAFIGVNNLFNRKYAEYAVTNATGTAQSFYPSPERNFFGGVSYTF